jgi:hypothetical protein
VTVEGAVDGTDLLAGARDFAARSGAELTEFTAASAEIEDVASAVDQATATGPQVVVGLGDGAVDAFSVVTAERLEQQFLVIGGQLPEPTNNVTAVVWDGASSRGSIAGPDAGTTEESVTEERVATALGVGVDSILDGRTCVVLWLSASR